jgi:hypothetical protein
MSRAAHQAGHSTPITDLTTHADEGGAGVNPDTDRQWAPLAPWVAYPTNLGGGRRSLGRPRRLPARRRIERPKVAPPSVAILGQHRGSAPMSAVGT